MRRTSQSNCDLHSVGLLAGGEPRIPTFLSPYHINARDWGQHLTCWLRLAIGESTVVVIARPRWQAQQGSGVYSVISSACASVFHLLSEIKNTADVTGLLSEVNEVIPMKLWNCLARCLGRCLWPSSLIIARWSNWFFFSPAPLARCFILADWPHCTCLFLYCTVLLFHHCNHRCLDYVQAYLVSLCSTLLRFTGITFFTN